MALDQIVPPQPSPTQGKQVRIVDMDVNQSYVQYGYLSVRPGRSRIFRHSRHELYPRWGRICVAIDALDPEKSRASPIQSSRISWVAANSQASSCRVADENRYHLTGHQKPVRCHRWHEAGAGEHRRIDRPKVYFEGSLPRRAESYGQVAGLLLDREFFGLPDGYWEQNSGASSS